MSCTKKRRKKNAHLELLFLTVLALPNASKSGFDCKKKKKNEQVNINFSTNIASDQANMFIRDKYLSMFHHSLPKFAALSYGHH